MDTSKKKIEVQARVRIIGQIKRQELTRPESFKATVEIERSAIYQAGLAHQLIETATRDAFVKQFRQRMRTDAATRRQVGGTRWEAEVTELKYRDAV
jgi:hypothetical protein